MNTVARMIIFKSFRLALILSVLSSVLWRKFLEILATVIKTAPIEAVDSLISDFASGTLDQ